MFTEAQTRSQLTITRLNITSPSPQRKDASDKNCEKGCRLQYGISEVFENILQQQQNVKTSKSHIQPQTFSDPKDQALYSHMLNDVMLKTFDGPEEQTVFKAALEGMNKNYPEILKGEEQNMFYAPSAFNFDSRIGESSCVPEVMDQMQASIESVLVKPLDLTLLASLLGMLVTIATRA